MRAFSNSHGSGLVAMETNDLRSFSHPPPTSPPSLLPVDPQTAEEKAVEHEANSNCRKMYVTFLILYIAVTTCIKPVMSDVTHNIGRSPLEPGQAIGYYEHIYITTNEGFFVDFQAGVKVGKW